jgi:MFS family permease
MTLSALERTYARELPRKAAVVVVAALIGVMFAGSTLLTPLYIIYKQRFGFSGITLTLIYAVYVVGNLAALLVFGRLSDQIGRRRAALPALAVAILSTLIFLLADGTAALYWARMLSGLGVGVAAGTAMAWLAELVGGDDKARATMIATATNFLGLGLGPLASGLLAQFAPWPLHLSFVVYLAVVVAFVVLIWHTPETVTHRLRGWRNVSLAPRVGVPRKIRVPFVAPAVTGFGSMALIGFFAALAPSVLAQELHYASHAAAGALVFELTAISAIAIVATHRLSSRAAMLWALALMIPSVALLVAAQFLVSLAVMIAATAVCALSAGLGYRGGLQVVNRIAPEDRRAEVVSSFFVCCFVGNALPVIGVGVISAYSSLPLASSTFAAMIALFALVALVFGARHAG